MKARKFLRVPVPMAVRIRWEEREDEFSPAGIRDISWGGAFLIADKPGGPGKRLLIEFTLSDDSVSLELWATVVRVEQAGAGWPGGVGVEFDSLDEDSRALIQRLVEEEVNDLVKSV